MMKWVRNDDGIIFY